MNKQSKKIIFKKQTNNDGTIFLGKSQKIMELNIEPSTIFWDTQNENEALYYGTEGVINSYLSPFEYLWRIYETVLLVHYLK